MCVCNREKYNLRLPEQRLLAHLMGIRTIAECAESHEVVDQLSKLGVDYAQGYAMGSPMPLDGLTIIH